ncbi:hypothetical protein GYB59_00705 [bacterium]|nr:hypothetical protein [bacterium]
MIVYHFTLIIEGQADLDESQDFATDDAIMGQCPDCTLFRSGGSLHLMFDREAASLEEALASAVRDVADAGGFQISRVVLDGNPEAWCHVS